MTSDLISPVVEGGCPHRHPAVITREATSKRPQQAGRAPPDSCWGDSEVRVSTTTAERRCARRAGLRLLDHLPGAEFGHGTLIRIGPGHQVEVRPGRGRVAIRIRQSLSEPVVARNPNSDSAHKKTDGADPTNKPILALLDDQFQGSVVVGQE